MGIDEESLGSITTNTNAAKCRRGLYDFAGIPRGVGWSKRSSERNSRALLLSLPGVDLPNL